MDETDEEGFYEDWRDIPDRDFDVIKRELSDFLSRAYYKGRRARFLRADYSGNSGVEFHHANPLLFRRIDFPWNVDINYKVCC